MRAVDLYYFCNNVLRRREGWKEGERERKNTNLCNSEEHRKKEEGKKCTRREEGKTKQIKET